MKSSFIALKILDVSAVILDQSCGPKEVPSPGVSGSKGSVCQWVGEADRNRFFFLSI